MSFRETLDKAISLLCRKKVPYARDPLLIEYFRRSFDNSPPIRPYHLDYPNDDILRLIVDRECELYLEAKYDGTHIQFSKYGIFKHDGKPISNDQLAGLMHICLDNPSLVSRIFRAVEKGYVIEVELFGKYYTPMGFHLTYDRLYDLTVFEVGLNGKWIPPPEKYILLKELKLPYPSYCAIKPRDVEELRRKLSEIAGRDEYFEGAVAKTRLVDTSGYRVKQFVKDGLIAFKVKVKEPKIKFRKTRVKRRTKREIRIGGALAKEINDELLKLYSENRGIFSSPRNIPRIINYILDYLRNAHPHLLEGVEEKDLKRYIAGKALEIIRGKFR